MSAKEPSLEAISPPLSRVSSVATLPDVDPGSCSRIDVDEFPSTVWHEQPRGSPMESPTVNDEPLKPVVVFLYDLGMMGPIKPAKWMFSLVGLKFAQQGYGRCKLLSLLTRSRGRSRYHCLPRWPSGGYGR